MRDTTLGLYLKTVANLGSLLPSVLLAYYIYRYRYLELIIEESLIVATFAAVVLTIYIYGIRTIGDWMTSRYGVRQGVVEALLILGLTLGAAPMRAGWKVAFTNCLSAKLHFTVRLLQRIRFPRRAVSSSYRSCSTSSKSARLRRLGLRRVQIIVNAITQRSMKATESKQQRPGGQLQSSHGLKAGVDKSPSETIGGPVEDDAVLAPRDSRSLIHLRREDRVAGVLLNRGLIGKPDTRMRAPCWKCLPAR